MIAVAAGLVLADAAVVVLALPPILLELDTSVEGVAAVIAVYTGVLALALPFSGRFPGAAGALLFGAASIGCASAGSLELLLVMRALQALGGAALLTSAFDALDGGGAGRRLWVAAAVAGTAAGPALGGLLTELFDWRAIFVAQAPIALAAVPVLAGRAAQVIAAPQRPRDLLAAVALALLSGALTAVLFLLVLLLISGWSVEPLAAAAAVTVLPVAAVAGSFLPGPAPTRAAAGCLLVAGGIACLALLPEASALWTLVPQLLAGMGLGMAFPALAGELLPERTRGHAAALLSLRHAGITLALVALAPIVAAELDRQIELARERGTAVVLDAALPPADKLALAPRLFDGIATEDPRDALAAAVERERQRVGAEDGDLFDDLDRRLGAASSPEEQRGELDLLAEELDEIVLAAVDAAFSPAFAITAAMALLAMAVLLPGRRVRAGTMVVALAASLLVPAAYATARSELGHEPVEIADPCEERERRSVGGVQGAAESVALDALDRAACEFGSSREELVLALFDEESRRDFVREHDVDPGSLEELLRGIVGL